MGEQLILRVSADGTVAAETKGVTGPTCLDSVLLLENLLDAQTIASQFTADYTRAQADLDEQADDVLRH
ncbi:MAG: DUF2997 domain-containing protein [Micrococcales bacterium]|nr:DUF2997 domain-containing protein [Micrococcales bacterium]